MFGEGEVSRVEGEVSRVEGEESYFDQLTAETSKIVKLSSAYSQSNPLEDVLCEFSELFSGKLGNKKGLSMRLNCWIRYRCGHLHISKPQPN